MVGCLSCLNCLNLFKYTPIYRRRDSSITIVTKYGLDYRGSIQGRGNIMLFSMASGPSLGPTHPIQWVAAAISPAGKEARA